MVHLSAYLSPDHIHLALPGADKPQLLREIAARMAAATNALSADKIAELLTARENLASTGVGHGIAIPHASSSDIDTACVSLFRTAEPVAFDAVDDGPVRLLVVVLAPQDNQALHLKLLATIARLDRSHSVRETLLTVGSGREVLDYIASIEGTS